MVENAKSAAALADYVVIKMSATDYIIIKMSATDYIIIKMSATDYIIIKMSATDYVIIKMTAPEYCFYVPFCTIMAILRQKKARSRDYALLE